ncbi:MAG: amidohydrolase family protein, partial [Pseudomonadota bacterium]
MKMKLIDLEAHFFTRSYLDYLRKNDEFPRLEAIEVDGVQKERMLLSKDLWALRHATMDALSDLGDGRLAAMDESGVSVQALTLAGPGCELFKPEDATPLVRDINDEASEVIKKHPDRFFGLAALAPQDPEAAAAELERAVQKLGYRGAKINSHMRGSEYLDEEKFRVILETAARLDVPIYLHPRIPSPGMVQPYVKFGLRLAGAALGFAADTSLAALRLVYAGVFDRLPNLKIILGHLGEGLSFWLNRVDHLWDSEDGGTKLSLPDRPSEYIKRNFVMTTSGMNFMPAFLCAYLALSADNIMFATDYPFEKTRGAVQFID